MNSIKPFFFSIFIVAYGLHESAHSQLDRSLSAAEVATLKRNVQSNPDSLKSRLFLGNHYFREKKWKQAIQYLRPMIGTLPAAETIKLAQSHLQLREYRQAESVVDSLLAKASVETEAYLAAVDVFSQLVRRIDSSTQKAIVQEKLFSALKTAQKNAPKNVQIYDQWLKKLELHVPHFAFEALRVIEDMKKNEVTLSAEHLSLQCRLNYLAEFTKQTKFFCQQAIKEQPSNPSNYIYLGQTHVNIGEDKVGKRMLASVGQKFSQSEPALRATADSYYQSQNIREAYSYYLKASKHKQASAESHLGLAKTAFELKKFEVALKAFANHCRMTNRLHHEFRRASGLLKDELRWQAKYRQKMLDCKPVTKR